MTSRKASWAAGSLSVLPGPPQLSHERTENRPELDAQLRRGRRRVRVALGELRLQAARERVGHLPRDVFDDLAAPDTGHGSLQPEVGRHGHASTSGVVLEA